jgi:putative membrane protein
MNPEKAEAARVLAQNQGLHNGFLAAGLLFGVLGPPPVRHAFLAFFLSCVSVAGLFGGLTVSKRILFVQAAPAALALLLLLLTDRS